MSPDEIGKSDANGTSLPTTDSRQNSLKNIPSDEIEDQSQRLLKSIAVISATVSGSPWPSAEILQSYNDYDPTVAKALIEEYKAESSHRRELERARIMGSEARLHAAQRNSLILALIGILLAGWLSYLHVSDLFIVALVIMAIGGPSSATVLSRLLDRINK
ncbi:MAG: DUF2335 domain-containing protein [Rhodospirillaceae bacterium]